MFVSVDGKAKEVVEIYAGGTDNKAHKVTELFGSVNGIAKQLFSEIKTTNAFDQFTWAEIKQLANDGLLLEHFNLYDRVTIKLTEPIVENHTYFTSKDESTSNKIDMKQDKLILQITSLTATTMRLSSPYASIYSKNMESIVYANDGFEPWTVSTSTTENYDENGTIKVTTTDYEDSIYWRFDKVLPEDLKAVAKGYEMLKKKALYSTGGSSLTKEICHVRNISEPINFTVTTHSEDTPTWYEITESQFPNKQSTYLYHYHYPSDFVKKSWAIGTGRTFLYSTGASTSNRYYYITNSPKVTYSYTDKYTKPDNGGKKALRPYGYQNSSDEWFHTSMYFDYIPEISIEAD